MKESPSVLIGIQARSTSTRFPRKHHEMIGRKRLLDHVIDACLSARDYVNRSREHRVAEVAILTPEHDAIARDFEDRAPVITGSELDVLGRYKKALDLTQASHVVRITGDCPLIPPFVISKMITLGTRGYDYLSNVDERCRTSADGIDCEFVSKALLDHMDMVAKTKECREHVTLLARKDPPRWARLGYVMSHFDYSAEKMSVDTPDDLERVREIYSRVSEKFNRALQIYPRHCIHRV